ncbi:MULTISPECIES: metal ABC transporter ATP-binding protein [unclassified Pseudoalteromonas]|uniref:metal ABC transporter ATP-binding protein n=1 Tax=unclassified Pseudoalteromonas TaxID=194690 RepID=UPI000694B871|nr:MULTISPECIES: metal ABC transporter ATP-binding protein [unclassified Pseudoalteromonas]
MSYTASDSASPCVTFDNTSVKIERNHLLSNINLTIEPGCWLGIVGPNGGGKSTLIKALLGLVPHQGGIYLDWPQGKVGNIGYVPQLAPFDATLPITVLDYLRMVAENRAVWLKYKHNQKIMQTMEKFQISNFADKRIGTLSTGERQRVLLCGALLNEPDILLLDEPLAGVDKKGHQLILDLLSDYHQKENSILMVEHHWHIVAKYCQQIALIEQTLVEVGSADKIFDVLQQNASPLDFANMG